MAGACASVFFTSRVQVVTDRETGRSRGFGFVEMDDGADEAIAKMNGAQFQGRTLTVNEAKPREPRSGRRGLLAHQMTHHVLCQRLLLLG